MMLYFQTGHERDASASVLHNCELKLGVSYRSSKTIAKLKYMIFAQKPQLNVPPC